MSSADTQRIEGQSFKKYVNRMDKNGGHGGHDGGQIGESIKEPNCLVEIRGKKNQKIGWSPIPGLSIILYLNNPHKKIQLDT